MKKFFFCLFSLFVGFLLSYLTMSFINVNIDFTQWTEIQRAVTMFLNFMITAFVLNFLI